MSGKPSAKPKPKPAQETAPAASSKPATAAKPAPGAKPAAQRTKPRPTAAEIEADDADPFEVDTRKHVQAPAVSPKPVKGKMLRVVCPMCETAGFIAPQQAGTEVKCSNPQCLVPVFTAPKPEAPPSEEPEAKGGLSGVAFAGIAVVLVGAVAAGLYYFVIRDNDPVDPLAGNPNGVVQPVPDVEETTDDPQPEVAPVGPPPVPLSEVRQTAPDEIVRAAQQRDNNRSKPYGRRLAAEAFAELGDVTKAREQLDSMRNVQGYVPFYEIEPLVAIAKAQRAAGDETAMQATLTDAVSKADFPNVGRDPLDAAAALAAALVVAGRIDDARAVVQAADDDGTRGFASASWRIALDTRSLNVDAVAERPWLQVMPSSQWVAVTRIVYASGGTEPALQWALSAENPAVRENALAVWAGALALDSASGLDQVESTAAAAGPTGQTRIWCAVADAQLTQGNAPAAQESLQRALSALQQTSSPQQTQPLPSMKAIHDSEGVPRAGLPDPAPLLALALAALDAAALQAQTGDPLGAGESLQRALAALRRMTPSPVATQALLDQCERQRAGVENQLVENVGVERGDVFRAFNRYRKQCSVLHEQAAARFDTQVELLRRAVQLGLLQPVWDEMLAREQLTDANEREAWFQTSLPGMVAAYARTAGDSTLADAVAAQAGSIQIAPRDVMELQFRAAVDAADYQRAGDVLRVYTQQQHVDRYPAHVEMLRAVSRLVADGKYDDALALTQAVTDPLAREDALWLIAAASVRDGKHSSLWRNRSKLNLPATEMASLDRGFITGLPLAPQPAPAE